MGYIKKLKNNELVGGTDKTTIYPVTSTEAVFEEITNGNESSFKSQKTINKEHQDILDDHEDRIQEAEVNDVKSITINGSTKKFVVDDENNVDLTVYTVDDDPEMPDIADKVDELRNMVGTSTPVLETSHKTRIETLEGGDSVTGSVENKIKTKVDSINSSYQDDDNEYVKYSMTQTSGEVTNFNIDETSLKNAITSLNSSISGDNIVIRSGSTPSGTGEPGKIYRYINSSANTYTDYMYSGGSWVALATHDTSNEQAQVAYYTCTATGSGAQATKQFISNGSLTYNPSSGGHIKILMGEANTATGTIYLQFGTTASTKKPLYYNGEPVSPGNTWEAGETIAVYYDPSANNNTGAYFASNAQGGGGKAEKIKYDNSQSGLAAENVQGALDEVSSNIPLLVTNGNDGDDLDITDLVGNILAKFKDGHLETKECSWVIDTTADGLFVADSNGNILAWLIGGQLIMGGFNSMDIEDIIKDDYYDIVKPTAAIKIYNTCNDIDKTTNKWGINSRNYGLSVFLDHFIKPSTEKTAKFDENGKTFVNLSQKIVGQTTTWNNGVTSYEESKNYDLNGGSDEITLVNRQILNSATSSLFPKILQIGDSVTQAWFANYPTIASAPTASWSWAKYFFEKDKLQKGSGFDSLLIGTYTSVNVDYDGTQFKAWAEGRGGWTAQNYWSRSSSGGVSNPFYDSTLQHFSLQSYLNKYKTLDDDGVTRLVVGSTAGTSVTNVNAYDVCTPNVVVLQLGMNGTLAVWQTYMVNIIQQIKSEFPNMKIIISCIDAALCMFPSLYPEYDDISLTDYDGAHARMIDIMKWAIDTLPTQTYTANGDTYEMTEANGIYVIYTGAIMPMPYSCNVREIVNPLSTLQEGLRRYVGVDAIERVKHPSRFAHAAIGYELYSAIKWVLMN